MEDRVKKLEDIITKQVLFMGKMRREIQEHKRELLAAIEDRKIIANAILEIDKRLQVIEKSKDSSVKVTINKPNPTKMH
tara:strand:+ start:13255 stop:13491 length:237 start_codon:yes stop_codon:yes gene_type:complete